MGIMDIVIAFAMIVGGIFCLVLAVGLTILNPLVGIPVWAGFIWLLRHMKKELDKKYRGVQ